MEQQLKHRLIGATVLVSLGVIFIPMVLSPPEEAREVFIDMRPPPAPEHPFRSRIMPLNASGEPKPKEAFEWPNIRKQMHVASETPIISLPQTRPSTGSATIAATGQAAKVREPSPGTSPGTAITRKPREPRKTAAVPVRPRKSPLKSWAVQVGSFTRQKNALGLRDRLRAKGYRAFVESVKEGSTTTTTRVFVGPALRRDDALQASKKLRGDLNIKGIVTRYSERR